MTELGECHDCQSLGKCCWMAIDMAPHASGRMMRVYSRVACPHLDKVTGLCTTYETRSEVPWCVAPWDEGASARDNNTPHWCPNNDPKGALMVDAAHYFQMAGGAPDKLEEFLQRIDRMTIEQLEETHGDWHGFEAGGPFEPTESAAIPRAAYKRTQEIKRGPRGRGAKRRRPFSSGPPSPFSQGDPT